MNEFCFQCGLERRPIKAVGFDEDGEPACTGHQVKEIGAGLNAAAASRPAVPAPIQFGKAFEAAQIKPAAPSPVQTSAAEESMSDKVVRTCSCGCGGELRGRWAYLKGHNKAQGGAALPTPKKLRKAKKEPPQNQLAQHPYAPDVAKVLEESDPFIVVRLRQSQISRLLGLLLQ